LSKNVGGIFFLNRLLKDEEIDYISEDINKFFSEAG
jgi:hypothetical protein